MWCTQFKSETLQLSNDRKYKSQHLVLDTFEL